MFTVDLVSYVQVHGATSSDRWYASEPKRDRPGLSGHKADVAALYELGLAFIVRSVYTKYVCVRLSIVAEHH